METAVHSLDWFEIPARDIDRAQRFYETLLGAPMRRESIAGQSLAVFDHGDATAYSPLAQCVNRPFRLVGRIFDQQYLDRSVPAGSCQVLSG